MFLNLEGLGGRLSDILGGSPGLSSSFCSVEFDLGGILTFTSSSSKISSTSQHASSMASSIFNFMQTLFDGFSLILIFLLGVWEEGDGPPLIWGASTSSLPLGLSLSGTIMDPPLVLFGVVVMILSSVLPLSSVSILLISSSFIPPCVRRLPLQIFLS